MKTANKFGRILPDWVISESYRAVTVDCEELRIQNKFSNPTAVFSDDSLAGADTVAFAFMTPEAAAYWLPTYLEFLKTKAAPDSNHWSQIKGTLTSPHFVASMRPILSSSENAEVVAYIDWWDASMVDPRDRSVNEEALNTMRLLWNCERPESA